MKEIIKIESIRKTLEPFAKDLINKLSSKEALHLLEFAFATGAVVYVSDNIDFDYSDNLSQTLDKDGNIIDQNRNCTKSIHFGKLDKHMK